MERYRVAVDVGGTFTDIIVFAEDTGQVTVAKVPSTPADPSEGTIQGLFASGIDVAEIKLFSHGTTVGTNALITRNLPRAGFVATKGFRDILEIRRGTKPHLWDAYIDVAPPYISRFDRLEVTERIAYDGTVVTPLQEDEARAVARLLRRRGIQTVGVCFLNAYVNPAHEERMKQILQEELPGVPVTISSEILPEIFEFERASTTAINAVLAPVVGEYMKNLVSRLRDLGYRHEVLVLHSGGGVLTAQSAAQFAARLAASGPAGGAVAMAYIARLCGYKNAIGLDMGGTSADISLMWQDELKITREWWVEYGYPIRFPSVDIITIGAGGGSIAWIDEGGSLRNGPQSAGAEPGPASYGKGGSEPTNTDANLVLGRLGSALLGGRMRLDAAAARRAIRAHVGEPLGLDEVRAASAIVRIANANMCDALRLISIQRGYDPRDFALVAFGGAGPLHAAALAREMKIPVVIVPPYPGITSALGCLLVDVTHDLTKTVLIPAVEEELDRIRAEFARLEDALSARMQSEGFRPDECEFFRFLDMRYFGQWRSLSIPVARELNDMQQVLQEFHREHERAYAYARPDQSVEIFGLRVTARGRTPKPSLPYHEPRKNVSVEPVAKRAVYFEENEDFAEVPVFARAQLPAGARLKGPAIVEQFDSTTVIPPGVEAEVDGYLNLVMYLG